MHLSPALMRSFHLLKENKVGKKVRLDKWLWAARFFKTRGFAKAAILGGKIHIDGKRAKASKDLTLGITLSIKQGIDEKIVVVKSLSAQRSSATKTLAMYCETQESVLLRIKNSAERKASNNGILFDSKRPNKKQRRQIHRFNANNQHDVGK